MPNLISYSREMLFSIRKSWKPLMNLQSHGSLKSLPTGVWNSLRSCRILLPYRGQRGGQHLRTESHPRNIGTLINAKERGSINVISTDTDINKRPRRANLHNLRPLKRADNNIDPCNKRPRRANLHNLRPLKRVDNNIDPFNVNLQPRSSKCELEVVHLNIRSLKKQTHLMELRQFVSDRQPDIVTISETWLNTSTSSLELKIEGYKLVRLDRLHKKGGGVCAYVRKELQATTLKELSHITDRNFHQLWLKVQLNKLKSIVICVVYRPDDSPLKSFDDFLKPNYIQALTFNKPILILGDLNCDCLKKTCLEFRTLEKFYTEMNLHQLIEKPTRISENSESLIDVILTSSNSLVRESGVIDRLISDHSIVFVKLKLKAPKTATQYINARSFKNYDANLFASNLASKSESLLSIFEASDVNTKLTTFNDTLHSALDVYAPIKTIKIRSRSCPYINQEIRELMKTRDGLLKRYRQTHDPSDWNNFKNYRNSVKNALREAEKNYTHEEVRQHKNNPSSLWKIINRAIPTKSKERQVYSKDLKVTADEFNLYFSNVGKTAAEDSLKLAEKNNIVVPEMTIMNTNDSDIEPFYLQTVSIEEVRKIALSLPLNKSPGPDKVNARIIRDCLPVILGPLTEIINCSILTNTFPDNWKEAEVIPILKDGNHELAANNRPLSLLSIASKICEKVVHKQLNSYLVENSLLTSHQSGNKKAHSTETLNVYLTDIMLEAMDKKKLTALVLLDLSKAFDSIDHLKLLHKLMKLGVSPPALTWFKSYLTGRTQSVRIGPALSDSLPITHGVPQGAILSPLLFCIYLNDLPTAVNTCSLESYVDDSKVFVSFPLSETESTMHRLELDLLNIAHWCCANNLLINPTKTKLLFIGTRQLKNKLPETTRVHFLGESLKPSSSAKDLGVILDSHLTYDNHISHVTTSCFSKLTQINRVRESFDKDTLKLIISSLVFSKLLYCSSVWSNTTTQNIDKLQSIQNFACKIVTNTRKYDHVTPLLRQLNWLPVRKLLFLKDAILTYKCLHNTAPDYLCNKFIKRSSIHSRNTRSRDLLQIPLHKIAAGQRSFTYRATSIWNSLDSDIKESKSLKNFKKVLKEHLMKS